MKPVGPKANEPILRLPGEAKPLRILLFVLTALSAAAVLFLEPPLAAAVRRGAVSAHWLFTPMAVYFVFLTIYAIDRVVLVKRRSYPAGKAFFQMAFAILFGLLILPSTIRDWKGGAPAAGPARLLEHPDAEVRQAAVESFGYRGFSPDRAARLVPRLDDRSPEVRRSAAAVMSSWSKRDAADLEGMKAWAAGLSGTSTAARMEGVR